jgi:cysteine desulfurase family protein (TIGR01976 family)
MNLMMFDPSSLRAQFPALQQTLNGRPVVFFDGPGGTQVPQRVIDALRDYLATSNANTHGAFLTSQRSDVILAEAHTAMADFLGAASPDEIAFGPNMTTLTFNVSRAIARMLRPGDEIVVTRLDHDANVAPWLALQEQGVVVRHADIRVPDCTLDMADLEAQINERTRLVAVGYASNATGTINDVAAIVAMAHAAGAWAFVDAVHYAPHGPIDVQALGCDFLTCSAYKFFGPHIGALYGRYELLEALPAYKVRPAPSGPPGKFETGTQNHEGLAGVIAALDYLADIGPTEGDGSGQRLRLHAGLAAIQAYERELSAYLLAGLQTIPGLRIWGIADPARLARRTPTFAITLEGWHPRQVADRLGRAGIFVWDGNYYALAVMERLGLEAQGGAVRIGLVHYNTVEEIDRLIEELQAITSRGRA